MNFELKFPPYGGLTILFWHGAGSKGRPNETLGNQGCAFMVPLLGSDVAATGYSELKTYLHKGLVRPIWRPQAGRLKKSPYFFAHV